jgi:hypothetical protein
MRLTLAETGAHAETGAETGSHGRYMTTHDESAYARSQTSDRGHTNLISHSFGLRRHERRATATAHAYPVRVDRGSRAPLPRHNTRETDPSNIHARTTSQLSSLALVARHHDCILAVVASPTSQPSENARCTELCGLVALTPLTCVECFELGNEELLLV